MTGVPAATTPILGRAAELARATDLLWNPDVRLVTIVGPGGIGKTRLAVEVAATVHEGPGFVDGVHLVELASVADAELVAPAVARALGATDPGKPDAERLRAAVAGLDALLVLDNFEHVISAAPFVASLLAMAPRLSILVTSRSPLHLSGEHEIALPPLGDDDAVALFTARARAVDPDFALDAATRPVVAAICTQLDGLPLAIELAGARSRVLSPAALRARLERDLGLLSGGPTDRHDRLRSMRSAIAWSYDALAPGVQAVFRQLSVFTGGWDLEGAEAVVEAPDPPVIDALATLLDQHLVRRDDARGGTRFAMFETVQEFARLALDADDQAPAVHRHHAEHYLALARTAEEHLTATDQVAWLDRIETEHDNVRAALEWSLGCAPDLAVDLAGAMGRFWLLRGYTSEGLDWLERVLAVTEPAPSRARAGALMAAGSMFEAIGDDRAAEARYDTARRDWEALGDRPGAATAYRHLGNALLGPGRYDEAASWYERARQAGEELGDDMVIAGAVSNLGGVAYFQGRYDQAEEHWVQAATYFRAAADSVRLAAVLNNLAELAAVRREPASAVALHEEALVLRQHQRDPIGIAQTLVNLGRAVHDIGDLQRARALLSEALVRLRTLGVKRDLGACLHNLALVAHADGRDGEAASFAGEALSIKHATGEQFEVAQCLELLAALGADQGRSHRSASLLGAAARLRRTLGARALADEPEADDVLDRVRRGLSEDDLARSVAEGETWAIERAVAEATEIAIVTPMPACAPPVSSAVELSAAAERLGLTARELEVLGYLAQRFTDREIADALVISLRTVTTHVGRILTKLGVDGRRQAATAAVRLGLLAS